MWPAVRSWLTSLRAPNRWRPSARPLWKSSLTATHSKVSWLESFAASAFTISSSTSPARSDFHVPRPILRDESLDLRGRVQARKGVSLGLAALAGGVQITGKIAKPRVGLDPDEKPALLARAAAAIASSGATLLGEALLDAASRDDACEAVFR